MLIGKHRAGRVLWVVFAWGAIFTGGLLLLPQWRLYKNVPKQAAWTNVETIIHSSSGKNPTVVFEPDWLVGYAMDRGRFKNVSVLKDQHVLNGVYPNGSNFWIASMFQEPAIIKKLKNKSWNVEQSHKVQNIFLFRMNEPKARSHDLLQSIDQAKVEREDLKGKVEIAEWEKNKWVFAEGVSWQSVKQVHGNFGEVQTQCVWFHPESEATKRIVLSGVQWSGFLNIYGGFLKSGQLTPPGTPVELDILVGGDLIKRLVFKDVDGFQYQMVKVPNRTRKQGELAFEISSENSFRRHFCFNALLTETR